MSSERLSVDLEGLSNLDARELLLVWRQHLKERSPDRLPRSLLAKLLAYRLQVEWHGGLSKQATGYLKAIEADLIAGRNVEAPYIEEKRLKPGTQIVREHEGVLHRIMVMDESFAWNGKTYPSLSAVAKAITGTNWNGHRFFGLKSAGGSGTEASL